MAEDAVTPLCSFVEFTRGAFGDLVSGYDTDAVEDALAEATRMVEDACDRRLAPFTVTETTRAAGIDPDEYAGASSMPLSIQGTLGQSYANSLGVQNLVRHMWLAQYPPRYPDLWQYPTSIGVTVYRSYGGSQPIAPAQILQGPDNKGHVWFQLGQFIPVGSYLTVTYPGGYNPGPRSLVRATKYMAASIIVRELNPDDSPHNPDQLEGFARRLLEKGNWVRGGVRR